ncbi:MAG: PilT/PilU family type 4a pilus ATPase [Acidimicrobiia bacterium]|nr:PilT/PilU family type 4a pilus ATPase [Acidimicrobiia bacterium]
MSTTPSLEELLERLLSLGGSDLHLKVGSPPTYRIHGELQMADLPALSPDETSELLASMLPTHLEPPSSGRDVDFAWGRANLGRFRVTSYTQRGSINVVVRAVPATSGTLADLGLPEPITKLANELQGLVVVTGPAGSGKTTTCAAIIDYINTNRRANIITLEDPIEVLHRDKQSIVSQREVGVDIDSLSTGLRSVLRQDPDVIYLGELRDRDSIEGALIAAETGHLVLTTMYTTDAVETVHRILDSFPPFLERRIRQMLGTSLLAIVSQRLLPRNEGSGRVPAVEVMLNTEAITERLVGTEPMDTLYETIAEGAFYGMCTLDQAIVKRYEAGDVSFSDALMFVASPRDFKVATGALTGAAPQ